MNAPPRVAGPAEWAVAFAVGLTLVGGMLLVRPHGETPPIEDRVAVTIGAGPSRPVDPIPNAAAGPAAVPSDATVEPTATDEDATPSHAPAPAPTRQRKGGAKGRHAAQPAPSDTGGAGPGSCSCTRARRRIASTASATCSSRTPPATPAGWAACSVTRSSAPG